MRQVIGELLDEWIPKGEFDFAEFASYFPVAVLCGVMGVSSEPIPRIRAAIESHMASLTLNRDIIPEFMAAYDLLWKFVDGLVTEREQHITARDTNSIDHGLLDALIATRNAGNMSDTELRYMLLVLLIGGYDTSKNMLTLTVHKLLQYPEYWARCAEDIAFCSKVIEEMLRHTTISNVFRNVKQEFDYQGHRFPKDMLVIFAIPLANRDPDIYPEPMTFDPERVTPEQHRHIAFGRGVHICPGQFLARAQLQEGLHLIAQRIPHPRLAGEIGWRPFLGAWGLSTLPLAVGPN
jgi:cytochrome P450